MTDLDEKVLAYRAAPTAANLTALLQAQRAHVDRFHRQQTITFIQRTS